MSTQTKFDKELDKILDLAGFQIFPASANKDREKAKQLIRTREATLVREARINELDIMLPKVIGYDILWANPIIMNKVENRITELTNQQKGEQ